MIRHANRWITLGLCTLSLAVVPLSLLFRDASQRADDPSWSSRPADHVIVSGEIKRELDAYPPNSNHRIDIDDAVTAPGTTLRSEVKTTISSMSTQAGDRLNAAQHPVKPHRTTRSSNRKTFTHTPTDDVPATAPKSTRNIDEIEAATSASDATARSQVQAAPSVTEAHENVQSMNQTVEMQKLRDRDPNVLTAPTSPVEATSEASSARPAPSPPQAGKSREEVVRELIEARKNGALPRFGNPDPYGPGGTPNQDSQ